MSVDIGVGVIATVGSYLAAMPFWHRVVGKDRRLSRGEARAKHA
jgi:hypothetical protein